MKTLQFDFNSMTGKDKAIKEAVKVFKGAGAMVVSSDADQKTMRKSGITYRNVNFTFADGQTVTMAVKNTGDVYEVRLNGKPLPLANQDDHKDAIIEIAGRMDRSRGAFQRALAKVRTPLPPSIRTSRANMLKAKTDRLDALKLAIEIARETLQKLAGSVPVSA